MNHKAKFSALVVALSLTAAACGDDATEDDAAATETTQTETTKAPEEEEAMEEEAMEEEAMEELPATVVEIAADAGSFTTLLAAAEAAGLVETLTGEGPLTVFAPTDDAFATALADLGLTAEELLADTETLTSILTYHVIAEQVLSTDLADGMTAATVNGADITVDLSDGVKINDATVTAADLKAQNGVVHVIDRVLLP